MQKENIPYSFCASRILIAIVVQFCAKNAFYSFYLPITICGFLDNMSACDIISIPPTITAVDSNE